jgi:hypothetical protein
MRHAPVARSAISPIVIPRLCPRTDRFNQACQLLVDPHPAREARCTSRLRHASRWADGCRLEAREHCGEQAEAAPPTGTHEPSRCGISPLAGYKRLMRWADLRKHSPRVLITCIAFSVIVSVAVLREFDVLTWLALAGVALLAHVVFAATIWTLDRVSADDEPRRR